jgi:hypothetical protein
MSIDLDITNYSINDLFNFFKLKPDSCAYTDVAKCANKMSIDISSMMDISPVYKSGLLDFINEAKKILYHEMVQPKLSKADTNKLLPNPRTDNLLGPSTIENPTTNYQLETTKKLTEVVNNLAKIINPLSNHPSLQTHSISPKTVLSYNAKTTKANYVFNTQFRDNFYTTNPEACSFTLPLKLKNVIEITLCAIQVPNVMLTFSPTRQTDQIYIYEEVTALNGIVTIPKGNYNTTTFPQVLEKAINEQLIGSWPNRFKVVIDPYNNFLTISNTTNNFRMNIMSYETDINNYCLYNKYNLNGNPDKISFIDIKNNYNVSPSKFCSTMGYLIGYRQPIYIGSNSYTAESMFNGTFTDYIYFCVDDYINSSQYSTNYGIFADAVVDNNVLAIIPITSPQFQSTFGSGADFINKTRQYTGPVDIQKISIKMLDQLGHIINLHKYDYGFGLEVTTICDISEPYKL